jgi:hypothetical protein
MRWLVASLKTTRTACTHAGKPDPLAALLGARRNVVISSQLSPLHPATVIDDGQRRRAGIGQQPDARRAGVERIGDDLSENGLLERAGVGVTKVFEEMLKVDPRFTHGNILSGDEPSLRCRCGDQRQRRLHLSRFGCPETLPR